MQRIPSNVARVVGITLLAAGLGLSGTADAQEVSLVWEGTTGGGTTGGDTIDAEVGDVLSLGIFLTTPAEGVAAYGVSLEFDQDGLNELDILTVVELEYVADLTCVPFPDCFFDVGDEELMNISPGVAGTVESAPGTTGSILTFEAATLELGPVNKTIKIGEVSFQVNTPLADGVDIQSGLFGLADGIFSNSLVDLGSSTIFGGASVNGTGLPPAPSKCDGLKHKLVGQKVFCKMKVFSKAANKLEVPDAEKLTTCDTKFIEKCQKAEDKKGDCSVFGNCGSLAAEADAAAATLKTSVQLP